MEEGGRRGEEVKERRWVESEGGGAPFYRRRFARCRGARPGDGQRFTPPHRPCLRRPSPNGARAQRLECALNSGGGGLHDCPGPRKPHAVKRPARPYKSAIQTDFLWKALRALNRPWAARTVPQCSCSSSKAARASACSSQTQRSPTFGQPTRRPLIAAASHRGGRLRSAAPKAAELLRFRRSPAGRRRLGHMPDLPASRT
jgi:hypothetical protein